MVNFLTATVPVLIVGKFPPVGAIVTVTSSAFVGTPLGLQLPAVCQSFVVPTHVLAAPSTRLYDVVDNKSVVTKKESFFGLFK